MIFSKLKISIQLAQSRSFWAWLNIIFNNVDKKRIKEVGSDIACAEWLLRNGASVKWLGQQTEFKDYNLMPKNSNGVHIEEIDATDSSIMHHGFDHFVGCNYINKIIFHKCSLIDNKAITKLKILSNSLSNLQITNCENITEEGLEALIEMKKLEHLTLGDFPYVKNQKEVIKALKDKLQECQVYYKGERI